MADGMDIDMDIDLTADPEIAQLEAEAMKIEARAAAAASEQAQNNGNTNGNINSNGNGNGNSNEHESTQSEGAQPVPTKINVCGLDNLTTEDIRKFAAAHYSTEELQQRVEWVDDTSANIVYNTEEAASHALKALTDLAESIPEQLSPLQARRAKPVPDHPDAVLHVRQATTADVKAPRAHEYSRFYLMNPEHNPRERKREYDNRDRRGHGGRRPDRRRREEPREVFDVSMYDDDTGADNPPRSLRMGSHSSFSSADHRRRTTRLDDDLLPRKDQGRLRNRSASPLRNIEGDGRYGFSDEQPSRRPARRRSVTPPPRRRNLDSRTRSSTAQMELFPDKTKPSSLHASHSNDKSAIELFPDYASPKRSRELFPHKTAHSNHRRSDALDVDETKSARRSLADRITAAPAHETLRDHVPSTAARSNGFSIRGTANDTTSGFSIRGASRDVNPVVKELFPSKVAPSNAGKELFAEKLSVRGSQRQQASDFM